MTNAPSQDALLSREIDELSAAENAGKPALEEIRLQLEAIETIAQYTPDKAVRKRAMATLKACAAGREQRSPWAQMVARECLQRL